MFIFLIGQASKEDPKSTPKKEVAVSAVDHGPNVEKLASTFQHGSFLGFGAASCPVARQNVDQGGQRFSEGAPPCRGRSRK
jgi:hypothetical protein